MTKEQETISKNFKQIHDYLISKGFAVFIVNDIVSEKYIYRKYVKGHIETRIYIDDVYKVPCEETVLIGKDSSTLFRWFSDLFHSEFDNFVKYHDEIIDKYNHIKSFSSVLYIETNLIDSELLKI